MREFFRKIATTVSNGVGTAGAFVVALTIIVLWLTSGPIFGFSDTWQLMINTTTTITTFLMVFLLQYTQNRDSKAIHIKLDELIRSEKGASNELIEIENMSDDDLEELQVKFKTLHEKYELELKKRRKK